MILSVGLTLLSPPFCKTVTPVSICDVQKMLIHFPFVFFQFIQAQVVSQQSSYFGIRPAIVSRLPSQHTTFRLCVQEKAEVELFIYVVSAVKICKNIITLLELD